VGLKGLLVGSIFPCTSKVAISCLSKYGQFGCESFHQEMSKKITNTGIINNPYFRATESPALIKRSVRREGTFTATIFELLSGIPSSKSFSSSESESDDSCN
jgi:hypothetical protein